MFVAIDQVFTLENILYLAKGALLSVAIAALSLLIGLVLEFLELVVEEVNIRCLEL